MCCLAWWLLALHFAAGAAEEGLHNVHVNQEQGQAHNKKPSLTRCSYIRMAASPSTSVPYSSGKSSAAMASRTSRARPFETLHLDIVAGVFIRARPSRLARARPAWVPLIPRKPSGRTRLRNDFQTPDRRGNRPTQHFHTPTNPNARHTSRTRVVVRNTMKQLENEHVDKNTNETLALSLQRNRPRQQVNASS